MTLFDVWTIFETHGTEKWWNFKTSRKTQTVRRDRSQLFQHLSRHAWVGKTDFKSQTDRSRARFIDMTPIMSWSTGISWKLASHAKFRYNKSTQNLQSPEHLLNRVPYFPPVDYCWPCVCDWVSEQVGQRDRGPQRRHLHQLLTVCVWLGVGTGRAAWSWTSASTSPPAWTTLSSPTASCRKSYRTWWRSTTASK